MLICLECNIDDLNPEFYPEVMEQLLAAGAKDVWLTPIIMKHGRPAVKLSALLEESLRSVIEELLFKETSTIGVRWFAVDRRELSRTIESVSTPFGELSLKISRDEQGQELNAAPEYSDCLKAAKRHQTPLKVVYQAVLVAYQQKKAATK